MICSCPVGSSSDLVTFPAAALPAGAARATAAISAGRSGHSATGSGAGPGPPTAGHSRSRDARSSGGIVTVQRTTRPSVRAGSRVPVVKNATGASPLTAASTAGSSASASRQITAAPLSRAEPGQARRRGQDVAVGQDRGVQSEQWQPGRGRGLRGEHRPARAYRAGDLDLDRHAVRRRWHLPRRPASR